MKRILVLTVSVILICTLLISCSPSEYSELGKTMNNFIKGHESAFSGSVLIAVDDKIILKKGYGMADYEKQIPNTPKTVFKIGSITKQFTSMGIMMLEERGLLSVNDPITKYIPDFEGGDKITIHHLLSMTSGIPDYIKENWYDCDHPFTVEELVSKVKKKTIAYEAGTKFQYSNSNYILLGYIIEKVSGMEYGEFLKKNIFEPLNMSNTCYDYKEDQLKDKAIGYLVVGDITKKQHNRSKVMNMSYAYAAGGLYSTVEDMYKWDEALYGEKLVKKETLAKIFTPNLENYGYGWFIDKKYKECVYHNGEVKGFMSAFYRFMGNKATIVVLANEEDMYGIKKICDGLFKIADEHKLLPTVEAGK